MPPTSSQAYQMVERLFFEATNYRRGDEDLGSGSLQLPLTANRATLLGKGDEDEGAGSPFTKAKRGESVAGARVSDVSFSWVKRPVRPGSDSASCGTST